MKIKVLIGVAASRASPVLIPLLLPPIPLPSPRRYSHPPPRFLPPSDPEARAEVGVCPWGCRAVPPSTLFVLPGTGGGVRLVAGVEYGGEVVVSFWIGGD